jgi:hypothetical protein
LRHLGWEAEFCGTSCNSDIYTVKKLRSLNLLFSCMFHIGRKTVHVGAEKFIKLYWTQIYVELENFSFTSNDAGDYATSE